MNPGTNFFKRGVKQAADLAQHLAWTDLTSLPGKVKMSFYPCRKLENSNSFPLGSSIGSYRAATPFRRRFSVRPRLSRIRRGDTGTAVCSVKPESIYLSHCLKSIFPGKLKPVQRGPTVRHDRIVRHDRQGRVLLTGRSMNYRQILAP